DFAGKTVEVNSLNEAVHNYCAAYITDAPADFVVTTTQEDIDYERSRAEIPGLSDGYLEELAVYRKISEKMPYYDTILFHGSVVAVDGVAYLFTAASGTGKSTHVALWRKLFGERAVMVNDDKPLLHIGDEVTAYGTPYDGKHKLSNRIAVPLKAICILERASANSIVPVTKSEAYAMLIQQAYRPNDVFALQKTLELVDKMADKVGLYKLSCNMDIEAAQVAYDGMNKHE
ncbi:MAG: hypothetical protein IKT10_03550, partial [Clostridiales bacterium]|nr:hypothetical protein [Clostridiales bacterium]